MATKSYYASLFMKPEARMLSEQAKARHLHLINRHGHAQGSSLYAREMTAYSPYINFRQNPVGYFDKK